MITQSTEEYFKDGLWGWNGTVWKKLSLLWGYTDSIVETRSNLNSPAVVGVLTFSTVPPGEVWRITQWVGVDVTTACTNYILAILRSATPYSLSTVVPSAANDYKGSACDLILKEGDALTISFVGTVLNDDIYGWVHGYKMGVS